MLIASFFICRLSGSYSIRGNSRLSDRSPDRQRNTVSQTSRYRDPEPDPHISQQQSSGYQTQVSGNQSELLETQSTATGAQLHFQSYRINHGEGSAAGNKTDNDYAKFSQDKFRPKEKNFSSDNAFSRQEISPKHVRLKGAEQKPPSGKETSVKRPVPNVHGAINRSPPGSPRTAHSKPLSVLPQTNPTTCDTMQNSPPRRGGYVIEHTLTDTRNSLSLPAQSHNKQDAVKENQDDDPKMDNHIFQHSEAQSHELYSDRKHSDHRTAALCRVIESHPLEFEAKSLETYSDRQNSDHRTAFDGQETGAGNRQNSDHRTAFEGQETGAGNRQSGDHRTALQGQETGAKNRQSSDHRTALQGQETCAKNRQSSDHRTALQNQETGAENQYSDPYVFENRLCSFLEDMDDIDDAIWDEQGNISKVLPQVRCCVNQALKLLLFSCSTQLSMKFKLNLTVEIVRIKGIFTLKSLKPVIYHAH